jgi:hypothetical protein
MLAIVLTAFAVKGTRSARSELSPSGCRPEVSGSRARWGIDHAEAIAPRNIARIKAMAGGIAIQDRIAFAGEFFLDLYRAEAASHASYPANAGRAAQRHYDAGLNAISYVAGIYVGLGMGRTAIAAKTTADVGKTADTSNGLTVLTA